MGNLYRQIIGVLCQIGDLSQLWYSGVSLTTARYFLDFLEISGCGVRGAGCGEGVAADAATNIYGECAQARRKSLLAKIGSQRPCALAHYASRLGLLTTIFPGEGIGAEVVRE